VFVIDSGFDFNNLIANGNVFYTFPVPPKTTQKLHDCWAITTGGQYFPAFLRAASIVASGSRCRNWRTIPLLFRSWRARVEIALCSLLHRPERKEQVNISGGANIGRETIGDTTVFMDGVSGVAALLKPIEKVGGPKPESFYRFGHVLKHDAAFRVPGEGLLCALADCLLVTLHVDLDETHWRGSLLPLEKRINA
jgi:hypothetical protein